MAATTLAQETAARQRADARIRAEGKGFAVFDVVTGWPPRPHFGSVEWQGPDDAPKPVDARDGDTFLLEVSR